MRELVAWSFVFFLPTKLISLQFALQVVSVLFERGNLSNDANLAPLNDGPLKGQMAVYKVPLGKYDRNFLKLSREDDFITRTT